MEYIVKNGNHTFKVKKGSNQGAPRSSQLFLIHVNDVNEIKYKGTDNEFNIIDFILKLFTDDLLLLANNRKEAQKAIDKIEYSNEKKLTINIKKTMWMEITDTRKKRNKAEEQKIKLYIGKN